MLTELVRTGGRRGKRRERRGGEMQLGVRKEKLVYKFVENEYIMLSQRALNLVYN